MAINQLDKVAASERRGRNAFESAMFDAKTWTGALDDFDGPVAECVVDLTSELISNDQEDHERRGDNRQSNRRRSDERQTGAKAHGSRSA